MEMGIVVYVRMSAKDSALLKRAAVKQRRTVASLIREAAVRAAERVLKQQEPPRAA